MKLKMFQVSFSVKLLFLTILCLQTPRGEGEDNISTCIVEENGPSATIRCMFNHDFVVTRKDLTVHRYNLTSVMRRLDPSDVETVLDCIWTRAWEFRCTCGDGYRWNGTKTNTTITLDIPVPSKRHVGKYVCQLIPMNFTLKPCLFVLKDGVEPDSPLDFTHPPEDSTKTNGDEKTRDAAETADSDTMIMAFMIVNATTVPPLIIFGLLSVYFYIKRGRRPSTSLNVVDHGIRTGEVAGNTPTAADALISRSAEEQPAESSRQSAPEAKSNTQINFHSTHSQDTLQPKTTTEQVLGKKLPDTCHTNDNETQMIDACRKNDVDKVRRLINSGTSVTCKDTSGNGDTPLHLACQNGNETLIDILLENDADTEATNENGFTPLHKACKFDKLSAVKKLLAERVDINAAGNDDVTPLHLASQYGFTDIVKQLLRQGADNNAKDVRGMTPLHLACKIGDRDSVKSLIRWKADVNAKAADGTTPIHLACQNNHTPVLALLLQKGCDVNAEDGKGMTALRLACENGHEAVKDMLITDEAKRSDDVETTPFHVAD